jgi:hypothetical protein
MVGAETIHIPERSSIGIGGSKVDDLLLMRDQIPKPQNIWCIVKYCNTFLL